MFSSFNFSTQTKKEQKIKQQQQQQQNSTVKRHVRVGEEGDGNGIHHTPLSHTPLWPDLYSVLFFLYCSAPSIGHSYNLQDWNIS